MKLYEMCDFLRDEIRVSEEALDLAFSLKGYSEDTAEDILFYYTGYDDFENYIEDLKIDLDN